MSLNLKVNNLNAMESYVQIKIKQDSDLARQIQKKVLNLEKEIIKDILDSFEKDKIKLFTIYADLKVMLGISVIKEFKR